MSFPRFRCSLLLVVLVVLPIGAIAGQSNDRSLDAVLATVRALEHVSPVRARIEIRVEDDRRFQEDAIELRSAERSLMEALRVYSEVASDTVGAPEIKAEVKLAYLGFSRTEGGTWIGRGSAALKVTDITGVHRSVFDGDVTVERVLGKARPNPNTGEQATRLLQEFDARLLARIAASDTAASSSFRRVTAVGVTRAREISEETLSLARLDALRAACAKVWGVQVDAVTRIVDLTDVTTRTDARTQGLVRRAALREGYSSLTSDGYLVVLVDAVIGLPSSLPREP